MDPNQREKIDKLARDVLRLSRNTLLVNLRFMDQALSRLKETSTDIVDLAVDGVYFLYNPVKVLKKYKKDKNAIVRSYLHMILHCVFRHMYVHTLVDHACWDLACDIAVEKVIFDLGLKGAETSISSMQEKVFAKLKEKGILMTAEKLYRYYLDQELSGAEMADLRGLFYADEHAIWYMTENEKQKTYGIGTDNKSDKNGDGGESGEDDADGEETISVSVSIMGVGTVDLTEEDWKSISESIQMDMETFSKMRGDQAGSMVQNLKEVNREKYDYSSFLKKFAVMGEVMKINDDEFDYIYYTYGMKLYEKMPLIEPLEYKDVKRIKEFVIAIDTSGSTSGELVQTFLQKTYNILMETESFFRKVNIHIIQCDALIREDKVITNREEFEEYIRTMQIHGLGGTDFRPVFEYVEALIEEKTFRNLKGLIYFTDGYGIFPERKPDYETAFVFVEDGYEQPEVPSWAIKLVLQKDEI